MHFYMDDSGTRNPDRHPGRTPAHGYDWFALGGVLIKQEDEESARAAADAVSSRVAAAMNGQQEAEVVELPKRCGLSVEGNLPLHAGP